MLSENYFVSVGASVCMYVCMYVCIRQVGRYIDIDR